MARRAGRKGDYLASDDYSGVTRFASEMQFDYWGSFTKKPLLRNLQEIASPLNDPRPVSIFRGADYESIPNECIGVVAPTYVGLTTVPTNRNNAAFQSLNLHPGLGDMEIGCSFYVS